ncbi:hypothetical protein Z043-123396 [Arapaima gigas]
MESFQNVLSSTCALTTEWGVSIVTVIKSIHLAVLMLVSIIAAGRFSLIQLIIYIGSTLSYYALTTLFIDWLISTNCYAKEAQQDYSERKFEVTEDQKQSRLCVSFVDEDTVRITKGSRKKPLQEMKASSNHPRKVYLREQSRDLSCSQHTFTFFLALIICKVDSVPVSYIHFDMNLHSFTCIWQSGIMGIFNNWDCDLEMSHEKCVPKYSFSRLDKKKTMVPGSLLKRSPQEPVSLHADTADQYRDLILTICQSLQIPPQ